MNDDKITVMQVFAAMGIIPSPKLSWSVGNIMQRRWAEEYGEQPPKDNRPKTGGGGSHCFALYPVTWRPKIEAAIRAQSDAERAQGDMFGDGT